ncbi:hypothetical protein SGRIM119S_00030 [Streptomyces griseorubiginosus]
MPKAHTEASIWTGSSAVQMVEGIGAYSWPLGFCQAASWAMALAPRAWERVSKV